jgi:hypothetical protein
MIGASMRDRAQSAIARERRAHAVIVVRMP